MLSYGTTECNKAQMKSRKEVTGMDELLLRRAQGGDPGAFEELITPLEQMVWRVCWHYTGHRETAEDCAQALADAAIEGGGKDNITVIVCRIR
jgi:hypothetical protein